MKLNKIFPVEWIKFHPYQQADEVDVYYTQIANKIYQLLKQEKLEEVFETDENMRQVSCYLTAYLEDVASGLGFWQAFTQECRRLYNKPLPFYEVDEEEYIDEEPNVDDIRFLLWHYLQRMHSNRFVNPENPLIGILGEKLFDLLDDEFELVPDNERMQQLLACETPYEDFQAYTALLDWFHYHSYLNFTNQEELADNLEDALKQNGYENMSFLFHSFHTEMAYVSRNNLLSIPSPEWLAKIISKEHPQHTYFQQAKRKPFAWYVYRSEDDRFIYASALAENEDTLYAIRKESFENKKFIPGISCIGTALVYYADTWWQYGTLLLKEHSKLTPKELNTLEGQKKEQEAQAVYNDFMKATGGERLRFFSSIDALLEFCRTKMKYDITQLQRPPEIGNKLMLSASPKKGLMILANGVDCIKHPDNPFYNEATARREAVSFYMAPQLCHFDVVCYMKEHNLLPDACINSIKGEDYGRAQVNDNWDFITRYFLGRCVERDL